MWDVSKLRMLYLIMLGCVIESKVFRGEVIGESFIGFERVRR